MKLSIIIPLFNSELYIYKCIESLLYQNISFDTYEIIVVNDGSTDSSERIVRSFYETNNNIILINQDNKGNGAARNTGMEAAKGEYLYFIDSDDYLSKNVLGQLLELLDSYHVDMLGFNTQLVTSSDLDEQNQLWQKTKLHPVNGMEFIKNNNFKAEVWWYVVKKSFFKTCGIKFCNRKFVQDSYITITLLLKANQILYVPIDAHRHRKHDNSITTNQSKKHISKHIRDMFFAVEKMSVIIKEITDKKCLMRLKSRQESYLFFLLMRFPKSDESFGYLNSILIKAKQLDIYPLKNFIGDDYHGLKYSGLTAIINKKGMCFLLMFFMRVKSNLRKY